MMIKQGWFDKDDCRDCRSYTATAGDYGDIEDS